MGNQIKDFLDSIPLIERVTNLRSVLLILVLMLWADLSLVVVTKTNLITHPWDDVRNQIHYGWLLILSGAFLAWYVVIVPAVNAIIFELLKFSSCIFDEVWPSPQNWHRHHVDRSSNGELLASSLLKWGVEHSDELAIRLATEKLSANEVKAKNNIALNNAALAFMILAAADYLLPTALFEQFVCPWILADGWSVTISRLFLIGFLLAVLASWMMTRPSTLASPYLFYPKAVSKNANRPG